MARFAKIGVEAGKAFNADQLSPEMKAATEQGMKDAWTEFAHFKKDQVDTGKLTSGDLTGSQRAFSKRQLSLSNGGSGHRHLRQFQGRGHVSDLWSGCTDGEPLSGANRYVLALHRESCPR